MKKRYVLLKFVLVIAILFGGYYYLFHSDNHWEEYNIEDLSIQHKFLTVNPYSRSGKSLKKVKGIVVHYTGNPGSSAKNNRDYFESLKYKKTTKASSHFIIGLKGEIIQCIPLNEISYASNHRNKDTISIECCHPTRDGHLTDETYQSLQKLVRSLMKTYDLEKSDIIRHYDVTGKKCPLYYVNNPNQWKKFINSLD